MRKVLSNFNAFKRKYQKCCYIPQRYLMALMSSLGVILAFNIRVLSVMTMIYIVKSKNATMTKSPDMCKSFSNQTYNVTPKFHDFYYWDAVSLKKIKQSFYWGYFVGHLPGGYYADMYGGKHIFCSAVILSAFFNVILPPIVKQTRSAISLIYLKFCIGVAEGALFPSLNSLVSSWTPTRDRGKISGIVFSATQFSRVITNVVSTDIIHMSDWAYLFYWYSGVAALWCLVWFLLCNSYPTQNVFISKEEKEYLEEQLEFQVVYGKKKVPWLKMLLSGPLWAIIFVQFGHTWIWHAMITQLNNYIDDIFNFKIRENLMFSCLPYMLMGCLTILLGFFSDFLINLRCITLTTARQIFTTVGAMGPGIFILAATFSTCHLELALSMFTIGMSFMSAYYAGSRIVTLDLAPNYSGIIMGLANGLGAIPGVIEPEIEMKLLQKKSINEWRIILGLSLVLSTLTSISFSIWGTGKEQEWNIPEPPTSRE